MLGVLAAAWYDPTGTKPRAETEVFAAAIAALGGMYAGKIRLVGTEAGLGVNQAGLIDARGTLTLHVNGWLGQSAGARLYGDVVTIRARRAQSRRIRHRRARCLGHQRW